MKKLLLVLLVVALASFLFVGCLPTTPAEGEDEGEGEAEICPTVAVTSQVAVGGKTYIKAGTQTITVTFAVPTEPVSVFVGGAIRGNPEGVPDDAKEVVMYTADGGLTYTGTFKFGQGYTAGETQVAFADCNEDYIYVLTCDACAPCKYPYIVDDEGPETEIEITSKACVCEGCDLIFKTPTQTEVCGETPECCGDYCSGFASYTIDLYLEDPFDDCCDVPCVTPAYSCTPGVACPVDCTLSCLPADTYYVVVTLLDAVGNKTRYYAIVVLNADCTFTVTEYSENVLNECTDWTVEVDTDTTIGVCLGAD
ncbi:MAG TPA: hypothetical protein DCK79_01755 [Candidatus Atribacteria bacterium]|nr:hypothetical protein [Candidatus Atribacteria bacterium]